MKVQPRHVHRRHLAGGVACGHEGQLGIDSTRCLAPNQSAANPAIIGATSNCLYSFSVLLLFIQSPRFLIDGLLRLDDLGDEWWNIDAKGGEIRGQYSGRRYRIGDMIRVRIAAVDVARRQLNLVLDRDRSLGRPGKKPGEVGQAVAGADKAIQRPSGQPSAQRLDSPRRAALHRRQGRSRRPSAAARATVGGLAVKGTGSFSRRCCWRKGTVPFYHRSHPPVSSPFMAHEIEAKLRVASHAAARKALAAAGATFLGTAAETDQFFDTPAGGLRARDCGLRLRHTRLLKAGAGPAGHFTPLDVQGPQEEGPDDQGPPGDPDPPGRSR